MRLDYLIPPLFLLISVPFWCGVCLLVSALGGWRRLAQTYRVREAFGGTTWPFCSGELGLANYNGVLTLGADDRGLYLAVFVAFRPGHPPLFIPWPDITITPYRGLFFSYRDLRLGKGPTLRLRASIGDRLIAMRDGSPCAIDGDQGLGPLREPAQPPREIPV